MFETNASTDSAIRANLSVGLLDLLNRDGMHAASGALSGSSLYSGRPETDLSRKGIANYAKNRIDASCVDENNYVFKFSIPGLLLRKTQSFTIF